MRADFARLPLQSQCDELARALADGEPLQDLLAQCAALSDPTPLAWLCARPGLVREHADLLASSLIDWPETSLLKVLRGLPPEPALQRLLRGALRRLGLERLSVLAMLERNLKHAFPESYEEYLAEIEAELPGERSLALLPARALGRLSPEQRQRRAELARQALDQLGRAPKAVSLSNAEELLSKRVYTQPGHFLFELLQNAEDAQARTFRVRFEADRVVVWHDGLPFDVRDLVGVTSIGQTTKKKSQIGFFGVGFKSVYEVTDRPQIYSDVFCFEIIDVSIPRALERPAEVEEAGTTLILPLKKPFPELPAIARQLDAGVLLTLSHLRTIDLGDGWVIDREGSRVGRQHFLLDESELIYTGPERESGRPDRTQLLLAVHLDPQQRVVPPPQGAPTIYSYLPTSQPSGLRFLIHSHFDVPVDRERINPESAWNRWILGHVPAALARLAGSHDLLEVLPLAGEASGPFAFLPEALGPLLREVACLPGGRRPAEVLLASPEMVGLNLPIGLWAPSGRLQQLAEQTLGCGRFGVAELIDYLESHPHQADYPALYAVLGPELDTHYNRLRQLAIVPDAAGSLGSPASLALASPELRALYPAQRLVAECLEESAYLQRLNCRRLQAEDLVADLEDGLAVVDAELALQVLARASSAVKERAARLPLFLAQDGQRYPLARLGDWGGAARASHPGLAQFYTGKRPLLGADYPDWPTQELDFPALALDLVEGRLGEIPHDLLEEGFRHVPEVLLERLAALPLWPDRPLRGAVRAAHPELLALFPERAFVDPTLARRAHVQALTPNPAGVEMVLEAFHQLADRQAALEFLYEHADEVSTGAATRLLGKADLPDDQGRSMPVACLVRAESPQLRELYRDGLDRPFVGEAARRLLGRLGVLEKLTQVGLRELLEDLVTLKPGPAHARQLVSFLASRAGELSRAEAQRCLSLPLFPDRALGGRELVPSLTTVWLVEKPLESLLQEAGWSLLEESLRPDVEELMAAALRQPAGIREVLDLYSRLGGLGDWLPGTSQRLVESPALLRLLHCMRENPAALVGYAELDRLKIWPTLAGGRLAANEVVDLQPLGQLFPSSHWELLPEAWDCFQALHFKARPALEFLRERLEQEAREGRPLHEQPEFLATPEKILQVAQRLEGRPLLDGNGCLRLHPLYACDELTLSLLPQQLKSEVTQMEVAGLKPLPSLRVVQAISQLEARQWRADKNLRERFYQWLLDRENSIFGDLESRRILTESPLWLSAQQRLLAAKELVLQEDVPDLGVDWYPHAEIPPALHEVLQRQLGVGKLRPHELLQTHLLPAYQKAVQSGERARADSLFAYLAQHLSDRPGLLGRDFPLRDRRGRYRPAHEVVWPDPELGLEGLFQDYLLSEDYNPEQVRFVRALGLAELPPWEALEEVFERPKRAATAHSLARLLACLYRRQGEEILQRVPAFRTHNWLPDALGAPRRPQELFLPGAELEALIGTHGRLYPDPVLADLLGDPLMQRLGLRNLSEASLEEVLSHLRSCSQNNQAVSFRLYQWLESGLSGWPDLKSRLGNLSWIYSDDGLWLSHRRTLGVQAFTMFGNRRGYWERGRMACPNLCRLFEIPEQVTPEVIRSFLEEVAAEVTRQGDREVMKRDKALSRRLLACYTQLGSLGPMPIDRKLPVILAQARPGKEKRLLPADHPALVSSDTPSLEALFEGAGTLYVAEPGMLDQRQAVEAFHSAMGIRNLRDAFSISLEAGGVDRSAQCAAGIARLRACLRSLLSVLPRVQRQRDQLVRQGWLDQQRLKPLAQSGTIRVIENLKVAYQLPGVGVARVQVPGAYDPGRGELLVDLTLAGRPDAPLTGLAQGLVPCLYQGPGEEQLVDILEILLPLDSRERMDAYLDARHFPTAKSADQPPQDRLGERLGELLDYQLEQRLAARFPELGDLAAWRQADVLAGCENATQAAQRLLAQAGLTAPSAELKEAVQELFTASSLDRVQPVPAVESAPPPPQPIVVPRVPEPVMVTEEPTESPSEGLLSKVRNWLWGQPAVQEALTSLLPGWAGGGNPFEPQASIGTQFWGTRQKMEELSHRPPVSGLYHQPTELPRPHQYAAHLLTGTFDAGSQRWLPVASSELQSFYAGQPTGRFIPFQGTLRPGLNRLPMPFYSRLHGELQLSCKGRVQQGFLGEVTVQFQANAPATARFQVEIMEPPRLSNETLKVPSNWLRPTMLDLPPEVVSWISRHRSLPPWERALAAQEFVTTRYAYDPDYLSHPEARRFLQALPKGSNQHLQLLHVRRQGDQLGFGMCHELNSMLCELLRHLEVPALLACGWVLDEGFLECPDHVFAVAVLASLHGPCLMPLDGAVSSEGPLRPLGRRKPPTSTLAKAAALPSPAGAWKGGGTLRPPQDGPSLSQLEGKLRQQELQRHAQAVRMVMSWRGVQAGSEVESAIRGNLPDEKCLAVLQHALRQQLPSPEVAAALVRLLAGDYQSLTSLPPAVEELVRLGLAQVQTVPILQVLPRVKGS